MINLFSALNSNGFNDIAINNNPTADADVEEEETLEDFISKENPS